MTDELLSYFKKHVPAEWFGGELAVRVDDDEIQCLGTLPRGTDVAEFREATREVRISIAEDAEGRFGRRVSWGVLLDGVTSLFTSQSTPVMTRLRFAERAVLDTLVRGGVARSRSDALGWCVKLVARHESEWLAELRDALAGVDVVRRDGPTLV
jgi:hypothetical protein